MAEMGKLIAEARRSAGIRQEDLAQAVGVTVNAVQQWEAGRTTPRGSRLQAIAAALGKSPAWFLGGDEHDTVRAVIHPAPVR